MLNGIRRSLNENIRWLILFQMWLIYYVLGMIGASITTVTIPISNELGLSHSQMGIILGTTHLIYIPLAIPVGLLIDKIGVKKSILIGSTLVSLSGILRAFSYNFETLFLSVSLMGIGGPAISVGLPKAVASWFDGKERSLASGLYLTGFIMGVATATAITNTILLPIAGSWRGALSYYGVFGVFVIFLWILFARDKPQEQSKTGDSTSIREGITVLLKEKNIWLVAIIGFSSFYVRHSLGGWLPSILEFRGMTPEKAGILASIPSWVGLIGSIVIPRIGSIRTRKFLISTLLFFQGICTYVLGTTIGIPLNVALILYGLSTYAILPLLMETMMGLPQVGAKYMGVAGGLFFSIGEIGGFLGPSMMGFFLDWTGSTLLGIIIMTAVIELMIIATMTLKLE